jgi:hypothetical protein
MSEFLVQRIGPRQLDPAPHRFTEDVVEKRLRLIAVELGHNSS